MINTMVHPANSSSAPATNVNFEMNNAAPIRFSCSRRRNEALTGSRLNRSPFMSVRYVKPFWSESRFNASTLQRFNAPLFLAALAMVLMPFIATAQTLSPANLPLYFEANHNQTEFLSSGSGYQFIISASVVQMSLRESRAGAAIAQIQFAGANSAAQIHGVSEMPGKVNYLIGNDPSKWQRGLPTFGDVQVANLYPGINLTFHGNQRQLEYDFAVAPGADPNVIKMQFQGVDKILITPAGDLVLKIGRGEIRQPKPEIYQTIGDARKTIAGGYKILNSRTVAFHIGDYDRALPLVIDPVLGYSTFFGGNATDPAWAIAMDTNGFIYIAGQTLSKGFATFGAHQTNFQGGSVVGDAYVAKFFGSPPTNLLYLTYLGGNAEDAAYGLAVDENGYAYVTGFTESPNFPTNNAIPGHGQISGGPGPTGEYLADAFVTELSPDGSNLIYSTYLGGKSADAAYSIALDSSDDAYVTGFSYSTDFPISTNALQKSFGGTNGTVFLNANAFVSEITNGGGALIYSTYLGGTNYDVGRAIAVDASNNVYVAGYSASFNFPTWNMPTNVSAGHYLNGVTNRASILPYFDAFATKFPPLNGTILPSSQTNFYSTLLGGTNDDMAYGIAVDGSGNAYVTGWTASTNFPVINSPPGLSSFLTTNGNSGPVATNVFLTKIAADGSAILNSAVFGGNVIDIGYGVAVDAAGDAFVVGSETSKTNFPTSNSFGSLLATNSSITGGNDAFVTAFSADWSTNYYSVCLGGKLDTFGYGIALDPSTNVFITGQTSSTNFPALNASSRFWFNGTNTIYGTNYINGINFSGTTDAFITEISFAPSVLDVSGIEPTNILTVGMGVTVTFGVNATGANGQVFYQWQKNGTNLVNGGRISGANSPTLTITNAQPTDSNTNYGLTISYAGLIFSTATGNSYTNTFAQSNIELTVTAFPLITTPLTNQIVYAGTNVSFSVTVSGSPLTYSWSTNGFSAVTNGGQFTGATNHTLTVSDVNTNNSGVYYVLIEYPNNSYTNDNATLTVVEPLSIISAPTNQTVGAGSTVSFSVVASGFPLLYQWTNNGAPPLTNDNVSGVTGSTLTITNVQSSDQGTYTVFVSNDLQSTNLSATLTVIAEPTFTSFVPAQGGGTILSGDGGVGNGTYYVLTSTNLLTPLNQWMPIATNQFNSQGEFIFTNSVSTNASQFFILKQP
jgi:hypothetical protein